MIAPSEDTWHALVGLLNLLATCHDFTGREAGTTEVPVSSAAADHPRSGSLISGDLTAEIKRNFI